MTKREFTRFTRKEYDKVCKILDFIDTEEKERSENGDVEACVTLKEMKKQLQFRSKRKPAEISDMFGDIYTACPNCGSSLYNYMNKNILPPYCMMCGQAIDWSNTHKNELTTSGEDDKLEQVENQSVIK